MEDTPSNGKIPTDHYGAEQARYWDEWDYAHTQMNNISWEDYRYLPTADDITSEKQRSESWQRSMLKRSRTLLNNTTPTTNFHAVKPSLLRNEENENEEEENQNNQKRRKQE